jgi:hypothetical protein
LRPSARPWTLTVPHLKSVEYCLIQVEIVVLTKSTHGDFLTLRELTLEELKEELKKKEERDKKKSN